MEQNPWEKKPHNLHEDNNMPSEGSSNESEGTLEERLLDSISSGKWTSKPAIDLMSKWRENTYYVIYNTPANKPSDYEARQLYLKERKILLDKLTQNLSPTDKNNFLNFVNSNYII